MKAALTLLGTLLSTTAMAGFAVPVRVPEPEMWALVGVVAAAFGVARFIRRK